MSSPVSFVSREACGLVPANPARIARRRNPWRLEVQGATVHWTVTGAGNARATWRGIQAAELRNGYGDISYNAGISDAGEILEGRSHDVIGAHALSSAGVANRATLGVAYIGNGAPSARAIMALRVWLFLLIGELELPRPIALLGHQDWRPFGGIPTACPGTLEPIVRRIRSELHAA